MTLAELQEMAARQQQEIEAQQQLLASKVHKAEVQDEREWRRRLIKHGWMEWVVEIKGIALERGQHNTYTQKYTVVQEIWCAHRVVC